MYSRRIITFCMVIILAFGTMNYVLANSSTNPVKEGAEQRTLPLRTDTLEALSNRQIHTFRTDKVESQFDLIGFEKVAQTEQIELWLAKQWNTIRIRNKRTGYLWGALPLEGAEGLNTTWNNYGNSIVAIECFDTVGTESRYSLTSNAMSTYTMIENGFVCHADFNEIGISFEITVELIDNRISFWVDERSIVEGNNDSVYRLKSMTFIPYLGSSYSDSLDGYLLIPDGSGALIRFQKPAQYTSTFATRVYGKDLGIESLAQPSNLQAFRPNDYTVEEPQILMPIYGVVHGAYQNGLFSVIESGAEYASILATPALMNNPYNWGAARFEFRQKYNKNINRKKGAGAVVPQEHRNELSPELSIYIVDGKEAHYDGMAILYRNILIENGLLNPSTHDNQQIPMRLEVLGADLHKEFIGTSLRLFTRAEDGLGMVDKLSDIGITNLSLIYKCYTKNNEAGKSLLKKVGIKKDFTTLEKLVQDNGGRFYYYLNPMSANVNQINKRTEAANNLSNMVIEISRSNFALMYKDTYFYRLREVAKRMEAAQGRKEYGISGDFALDGISYRLYGDFTSGKERTRSQNLETVISLVDKFTKGERLPLYQPNQYLWGYTSEFYNAPLSSGQFLYETDTIPFLQIVLNGSIQLFGTPLNTGTYSKERLLRHIEYGIAPSFAVTECNSIDLYKTAQEDYFATNFNDWERFMNESYHMISDALSKVKGQAIVEHKALEDGFILVTYENAVRIYVNYTGTLKSDGNIMVEPGWYQVVQ